MRQLHRREAVDADCTSCSAPASGGPATDAAALSVSRNGLSKTTDVDVVVEQRTGVAGAQQQRIAHELGARVDLGQVVVGRGRELDQAAVAEAAAERESIPSRLVWRTVAVDASAPAWRRTRSRRSPIMPARPGVELLAELVEERGRSRPAAPAPAPAGHRRSRARRSRRR